ncbi:hypothetical protein [Pseudomonas jinjuensis]|uniref:hypothetical protein n=1 Tax=Pseudomonas jinjuensis TaxID=198616 RepID=UPI00146FB206|nr:hypothetical protein [Pseudomonas jinjuensis]
MVFSLTCDAADHLLTANLEGILRNAGGKKLSIADPKMFLATIRGMPSRRRSG